MRTLLRWLVAISIVVQYGAALPASALETQPSTPPLSGGPFIITEHSFQGHSLRYVQITNNSSSISELNGWRVRVDWADGFWQSENLNGLVLPDQKVTLGESNALNGATFSFSEPGAPTEPRLSSISLIAPANSGLLDVSVPISVTESGTNRTVRDEATLPATFYFARNVSSATGNYLSSYSAFLPAADYSVQSDLLYAPPTATNLQIVELYPKSNSCSPTDTSPLCFDYIKLYNPTANGIDLGDYRLRTGSLGQSATSSNTAELNGILPGNTYFVVKLGLTDSGNWAWLEDTYGMKQYDNTVAGYPSASGHDGWGWALNTDSGDWQWTKYPTPYNQANQFSQGGVVNECSGLRLSEIGANYSPQFIEVYNATSATIDVSGCQLQTNRSQSASYAFSDGAKIASGGYLAIDVAKTDLTLTKTTAGTVYVLSSDSATEVDARSYEDLDENTSFALVDGLWQQTFAVTPGSANKSQAYPACEVGYERNLETGRCNKLPVATVAKACLPTQYRSPETNRCRNLATAASSLTPCKAGQYRSPETNRCRSLTSASSTLKPCAPNQKRNPDTNRCRNVADLVQADFPVETVAQAGEAAFGWWAFGGVGMVAAGYAGWEWRREALSAIRKFASFIPTGK